VERSKWTSVTLAVGIRADVVAALLGKYRYSAIEAGRQGLHQGHPERFQRQPNANHGALDCAQQHRLFRQLKGLQRARPVSL
jgi:hypothetical protein